MLPIRSALALAVLSVTAGALSLRSSAGGSVGAFRHRLLSVDVFAAYQSEESFVEFRLAAASQELLQLLNASSVAPAQQASNSIHATALAKQNDDLKALVSHLKANIKSINQEEVSGKDTTKKQVAKLQKRLAEEQEKLKSGKLSDFDRRLLVNRTRTDEEELHYWTRSRELEHGMFHSSLKMTHGLMAKANAVLEAYKEAMSTGKLSPKAAEAIKAVAEKIPKA